MGFSKERYLQRKGGAFIVDKTVFTLALPTSLDVYSTAVGALELY